MDSTSGASDGGQIGGGAGGLGGGQVFVNIDAVALEGGEQVVDLLRGMHFGGQDVVYFVIEQVAPLLAHGNELPYLIIFFFNRQRQGILPKLNGSLMPCNGAGCAEYLNSSIGKIRTNRNRSFVTRVAIENKCPLVGDSLPLCSMPSAPPAPQVRRGASHITYDANRPSCVTSPYRGETASTYMRRRQTRQLFCLAGVTTVWIAFRTLGSAGMGRLNLHRNTKRRSLVAQASACAVWIFGGPVQRTG